MMLSFIFHIKGTRIIYDRSFLLQCRNSPLTKSPPPNLPKIPGVTSPEGEVRENGHEKQQDPKSQKPVGEYKGVRGGEITRNNRILNPRNQWVSTAGRDGSRSHKEQQDPKSQKQVGEYQETTGSRIPETSAWVSRDDNNRSIKREQDPNPRN